MRSCFGRADSEGRPVWSDKGQRKLLTCDVPAGRSHNMAATEQQDDAGEQAEAAATE